MVSFSLNRFGAVLEIRRSSPVLGHLCSSLTYTRKLPFQTSSLHWQPPQHPFPGLTSKQSNPAGIWKCDLSRAPPWSLSFSWKQKEKKKKINLKQVIIWNSFFLIYFYLFIYFWLHWTSHCSDFSCCWAWTLELWHHELSCSAACRIFPDQGSNLCPLHWQAGS